MKENKSYKKNWGSVYQVRLSKEEKKEFTEWINKFGLTHREVLMTVVGFLNNYSLIKNGWMYSNLREYAYSHGEYHKYKIDKCELCSDRYRGLGQDNDICGHHNDGYDEENIEKVHWICRRCHGFVHRRICKNKTWEEIIELHKNFNGKTRAEEYEEYELNLLNEQKNL